MGAIKNAIAAYYTEAGAGKAAGTLALVASTYGVAPPTQYINAMAIDVNGNISTTITNIGSDVNGTTLNLNTTDFKQWNWGGSLPDAYKTEEPRARSRPDGEASDLCQCCPGSHSSNS